MALYLDGTSPPIRTREVNGLASGQYAEACVLARLPATGQHSLMVIVDEPRGIFEENDTNNWFAQPYVAARVAPDGYPGGLPVSPVVADPGPNPGVSGNADPNPSQGGPPAGAIQADLAVSTIRVNGKEPSDKYACEEGKNDVTVVIKNQGTALADRSVARLVVDGDLGEAEEKTVPGLEAGQEREVRFDDVRLNKGQGELKAIADADSAVAEADEGNNERQVTATCKDD